MPTQKSPRRAGARWRGEGMRHDMVTKLRMQAAEALDLSLDAATRRQGLGTDKVRDQVAAYLDHAIKLKPAHVRRRIRYLRMIAR